MRRKITVVGERIGATIALLLAERDYAQVVLFDETPGAARASARDLDHAAPALGCEPRVWGTEAWEETAGSQIVVVTSAPAATDGADGGKRMQRIAVEVARRSPDAVIVVAAGEMQPGAIIQATLFPRQRVLSAGPTADSAALRAALASELLASVRDVSVLVLGGRGEGLVPVLSAATVAGTPIRGRIPEQRLDDIVTELCVSAAGAPGPFATAAAAREVVDAIVFDAGRVLSCGVLCQGEYGLDQVFLGVPVRLGAVGVEEVVELPLADGERQALQRAAEAARRKIVSPSLAGP